MNAVAHMISLLPPAAIRRLAQLRALRAPPGARRALDIDEATARVLARWDADLCGLLNALSRGELAALADRLDVHLDGRLDGPLGAMPDPAAVRGVGDRARDVRLDGPLGAMPDPAAVRGVGDRARDVRLDGPLGAMPDPAAVRRIDGRARRPVRRDDGRRAGPRSSALRAALWDRGATLERGGAEVSPAVQPRPIVLGGHLVVQAAPRGLYPPSPAWPRPLPAAQPAAPPPEEPEALDDLLAAADRAIGVRLGARGRDKGAWGVRAARLLGIVERNEREPDWRGDVEVKTVPVARDPSGWWRVVEDPAIAMANEPALAKLQRTLWLARSDVGSGDATIVSWYLLDWDPEIARLTRRYLHTRPKGPAGTDARGLYLHKRFFADAGLLATLNGSPEGPEAA